MPLMPKRTKFRKSHRGSRAGNAQRGTDVSFGDFGLQALERGWMPTARSRPAESPSTVISSVRVKSGFGFSLTNQPPLDHRKLGWVRVKVQSTLGSQ